MSKEIVQRLLVGTVLSCVAGASGAANAQQAPAPSTTEIVVTGTRIQLQDYVAPNPVVSVTAEAIENSGTTNLTDFLTGIPALAQSLTLEEGADTATPTLAGLNLLNLRGLGTSRTLVLVNGRRHVSSSPGSASVDVNSIPQAQVARVEVLTGGASAVYGADGVSGVVNFILKDDFEGIELDARAGESDEGGGANQNISLLLGKNTKNGKGNVSLAFEYNNDEPLKFTERSFTRPGQRKILISNPDDPGTFDASADDPNIPDNILASNVRYIDTSKGGSIYTNFSTAPTTSGVSFNGDGTPFVDGLYAGGFFMIGGDGTLLDEFNDDLLPGLERFAISTTANYELTPAVRAFAELKFTNSKSEFFAQPSYFYGLWVPADNPFIPAAALADAQTPGGLANPLNASPDRVLLARDNFDLGTQSYEIERETLRGVLGLEGDFTDHISWEASYTYGKSERTITGDTLLRDRVYAAADVVNGPSGPVCRSNLDPTAVPRGDVFGQFPFSADVFGVTFTPGANSGCLPLNLFGENKNSQAALDWIRGTFSDSAEISQKVFTGFVTGDTTGLLTLPAGPIGFVVGLEYREEESDFRPSSIEALAESLEYPISDLGRSVRTQGGFDVKEAFLEVTIPVLKDLPFVQRFDVSGAFRTSDYSTSGGVEAYNANARWALNDSLAFRGGVARAVRAPNITDLFRGREQTFGTFADPCSQENLNRGENPAQRQANCATDLTAIGVDPTTFVNNSSEAVAGFITGNTKLDPETAETFTVGFVATPSILPGLSISIDYYDIEIVDAIQSISAQNILNLCYDLARPNNFCELIQRGESGGQNGRIISFEQQPQNTANYVTRGFDMTARYALDPARFGVKRDIGTFDLSLIANHLQELTFIDQKGAPPNRDLGEIDAPEWTATFDLTWNFDRLQVNYGYSWFDETFRYGETTRNTQPDIAPDNLKNYSARSVHDIQARFDVTEKVEVYGGVNNFTNQEPDPSGYEYPVSPLGRYFYVGAKLKIGS